MSAEPDPAAVARLVGDARQALDRIARGRAEVAAGAADRGAALLGLAALGLSVRAIARELGVSAAAVQDGLAAARRRS